MPALIGQKYHKKLHVHMRACACECGNMTKFIRQKGGAECKHSETKFAGEVDQRHKLTLTTWSDIVNLNARLYTMVGPTANFFSDYFGVPWIFIIKVR